MKRSVFIFILAVVGMIVSVGSPARGSAILPGDLIAYWALDGDLTDSAPAINGLAGPGSDGTYTGGITPTFVTVDGRQALDMQRDTVANNYVQTQTHLDGGPKTVVLWVNSTYDGTYNGGTERGAFWAGNERGSSSQSNRLFLGKNFEAANIRPWIGAGSGATTSGSFPTAPDDGNWHMYVLTDTGNPEGTGGTIRMYQDDATSPVSTYNYSGSTASPAKPFVIGEAGGWTPFYARAHIDDVAVFNRMLTTDEMARIYSTGSVLAAIDSYIPTMPKHSWLFDGNAKAQLGGIDGMLVGQGDPGDPPTFGSTDPSPPFSYDGNQYLKLEQSADSQQYVDFGQPLQFTDAITASLWFKADGAPESGRTQFLLGEYGTGSGGRSWSLATYSTSGTLRLLMSDTGGWGSDVGKDYFSTFSVTDGEWHHVAFTFEGSSDPDGDGVARLYLDGVELTVGDGLNKSKDNDLAALNATNLPLMVGTRSDLRSYGNGDYFAGLIDEVAVWNSVLSPGEINWLYHSSIYAIPEPSTFVMLLLAGAAMVWPRRRRRTG